MPRAGDDGAAEAADCGGAPAPAASGRIIFLNGTSSSGKSSIAKALLQILGEPSFHMPVDAVHAIGSVKRSV